MVLHPALIFDLKMFAFLILSFVYVAAFFEALEKVLLK